ncbi:lanthionine synthetase C family protein, partial [Crossiella equi]
MSFARPGALPPEQAPDPGWSQSLSSGAAGLALLHIGYAHAGLTDWACAHQWVQAMTSHPVAAHPSACLFQGAPAVAFVLRTAALPAYTPVLHALDEHVTAITRARLVAAHERIDLGELPALREFDLINGLTGLGAYLLQALRTGPRHHNGELLREVLAYLIRLTGPITVEDTVLPGWWTENGPSDRPDSRWPGGHANLGLAHGIAGPWALLSAAMISGLTVPGHTEAIEHITRFFSTWSGGWPATPWWPGLLSAREWGNGVLDQPGPQQPSWCYGTPGVLHAHHLAAQA